MKNITVDLAGKGIDATKAGSAQSWGYVTDITDEGIDASKFGAASAFDYTKNITDGDGIDPEKICTGASWDHTKNFPNHGFVSNDEGEAVDKMSSSIGCAGRKLKNASESLQNATSKLSGKSIDSTNSAAGITDQVPVKNIDSVVTTTHSEFDHTQDITDQGLDGTSTAWDQTSNPVYNTGNDIYDAVKRGAVDGWNKVTGDK